MRYDIKDQPGEIAKSAEALLKELTMIKDYKETLQERNTELRSKLMETLKTLGLKDDDHLDAGHLGVSVHLHSTTRKGLSRDRLELLGVPNEILDEATVTTHSEMSTHLHALQNNNEMERSRAIAPFWWSNPQLIHKLSLIYNISNHDYFLV